MHSKTYTGDPRWCMARFASACASDNCDRQIKKGEEIFYFPRGKHAFCASCGEAHSSRFEAEAWDEENNLCM